MTEWDMYWITRLDAVHADAWIPLAVLMGFMLLFGLAMYILPKVDPGSDKDRNASSIKMGRKLSLVAGIFLGVMSAAHLLVPTTGQMAAILVLPKIINNEQIQDLPDNLVELANEWTKAKTEELKAK